MEGLYQAFLAIGYKDQAMQSCQECVPEGRTKQFLIMLVFLVQYSKWDWHNFLVSIQAYCCEQLHLLGAFQVECI